MVIVVVPVAAAMVVWDARLLAPLSSVNPTFWPSLFSLVGYCFCVSPVSCVVRELS